MNRTSDYVGYLSLLGEKTWTFASVEKNLPEDEIDQYTKKPVANMVILANKKNGPYDYYLQAVI
jgi:hypothetical protein